jgi:hypothetical protein
LIEGPIRDSMPAMNQRIGRLLSDVSGIFNGMPAVFSTPQWGGRAYKLPGRDGDRGKPRLLAHITMRRAADAVNVDFKLPPDRAAAEIDRLQWLSPHSFRTLAPAGWVTATLSDRRRVRSLARLLAESRALHGETETLQPSAPHAVEACVARSDESTSDGVARRINRVMREANVDGWTPDADGESWAPSKSRPAPMTPRRDGEPRRRAPRKLAPINRLLPVTCRFGR